VDVSRRVGMFEFQGLKKRTFADSAKKTITRLNACQNVGDAQAGWLGAVPCDSGKALTRRWADDDRARPPRWRARAETALPRRGRLVWRSGRDSTENIIHDVIAEFARLHLSCPIRPWNIPGVHVDAAWEPRPATASEGR